MQVNKATVAIINAIANEAEASEKRARNSAKNGFWRCAAEEYNTARALRASIEALKDGHLTTQWLESVFPNLK